MNEAKSVLRGCLEKNWGEKIADVDGMWKTEYAAKSSKISVYSRITADGMFLFVHSVPEGLEIVPAERIEAVAEFFTRVNPTLSGGSFDIDLDSGAIRFRFSMPISDAELTAPLAANVLRHSIHFCDHRVPALRAIVHDGISAEAAMELVD